MKIYNFIKLNDWKIKNFLIFVMMVQLSLLGTIVLDNLGVHISLLREFLTFIYLIFIPGFLILRVLKLHNLSNIETLLYAVGLSITSLMIIGLFMNVSYPFFGFNKPISLFPLIATFLVVTIVLSMVSYIIDRDFYNHDFIEIESVLLNKCLIICLIPFLAILGTYLMNFYKINFVLILLIVIISIMPILVVYYKVSSKLYPLILFVCAISLLFSISLISNYVTGYDIQVEYYLSNLVIIGEEWNPFINQNVNGMLSIVMLAPIFSIIGNTSLDMVFKVVYIFLFSLVPVGLYRIYQKQTNSIMAFFSTFLFISIFTFFLEMPQLARQEIAELFVVLLVLLLLSNFSKTKASLMFVFFSFALVSSHYGLSYIFLISFILAWFILITKLPFQIRKLVFKLYSLFRKIKISVTMPNVNSQFKFNSVLFLLILALSWYMYVSSSSSLELVVNIGHNVLGSFNDFLNPDKVQGLYIITSDQSLSRLVTKYLYFISQFFIVIGIIYVFLRSNNRKIKDDYLSLSYVYFLILILAMIVPLITMWITSRVYQISLIFLSLFFPIGLLVFFHTLERISKKIGKLNNKNIKSKLFKLSSIFLTVFLLFNSGLIYEITNDNSTSIALNQTIDAPNFNYKELEGGNWLKDNKGFQPVYADGYRKLLLIREGFNNTKLLTYNPSYIMNNSYIYYGTQNTITRNIMVHNTTVNIVTNYINYDGLIANKNKIYSNGGAEIYYYG